MTDSAYVEAGGFLLPPLSLLSQARVDTLLW